MRSELRLRYLSIFLFQVWSIPPHRPARFEKDHANHDGTFPGACGEINDRRCKQAEI